MAPALVRLHGPTVRGAVGLICRDVAPAPGPAVRGPNVAVPSVSPRVEVDGPLSLAEATLYKTSSYHVLAAFWAEGTKGHVVSAQISGLRDPDLRELRGQYFTGCTLWGCVGKTLACNPVMLIDPIKRH